MTKTRLDWQALIATLCAIVIIREFAVWLMGLTGHPELGNLVGLAIFLIILIIWRTLGTLSLRMIDASAIIMKESAFAFLPVSAGSVLMLIGMSKAIPVFLLILAISTLIPLWCYARLAKRWL